MPSIHLESVSHQYTSAHLVFSGVDLHLGPGWVGVVGPNGSGKSTLLALMAGTSTPTEGTVNVDASVAPVLCSQSVHELDPTIVAYGESYEPDAFASRGRLGLEPAQLERWKTLSPGERKRWQVGAALWHRPDVLLLDEPTNHLDSIARQMLIDELERFRGVGVVVSHDRELLDGLTASTIRVESGSVESWGGSYSVASTEWAAVEEARLADYRSVKRELAKTERRIADRRRALESKSAAFARTMQRAAAKDHDTHSTMRKGKHALGEAAASRGLSNLAGERDRLRDDIAAREVSRSVGGSVRFEGEPARRQTLVRLEGPLVSPGGVQLAELDREVERTSRIHLAGPNGAGKTTLLRSILERCDLEADRILWLPQELSDDEAREVLEAVRSLPRRERGRVLALVALLGTDPDVVLASEQPSPGEARKLSLALGIGTDRWLLLLDEPTNHLDLPTVERLEAALADYPGAMVVVSHDHRFAEAICTERWTIRSGRVEATPIAGTAAAT